MDGFCRQHILSPQQLKHIFWHVKPDSGDLSFVWWSINVNGIQYLSFPEKRFSNLANYRLTCNAPDLQEAYHHNVSNEFFTPSLNTPNTTVVTSTPVQTVEDF